MACDEEDNPNELGQPPLWPVVRIPNKEHKMTLTLMPSDNDEAEGSPLSALIREAVLVFPPGEDSFDRLMERAVTEIGTANCLARKQTLHVFRAGANLAQARIKLPPGLAWSKALAAADIPRTTAWEAMKLYELAGSEDALANLTITEAKAKYGITKPKKADDDETDSQDIIAFNNDADPDALESSVDDHQGDDENRGVASGRQVVPRRAAARNEPDDEELGDDHTEDDDEGDDEPATEAATPPTPPSESPFDTLAKVVKRLEYLEADLQATDLQDEPRSNLLHAIDLATEILGRIRQTIALEA